MAENGTPAPSGHAGRWKPIVLLLVVVAMVVVSSRLGLGKRVAELKDWVRSLGPWGPVAYVLIYIAGVVAAFPGGAMTVVAGALFGSVRGVICVSIASTVGASLCFLIARFFARDAVARWLSGKEKFQRLDRLTETHGAMIVAIARLVPLFPFNIINYGFGLTRVRFWTYVLVSWVCMMPGTIVYVVGADAIVTAVREGRVPWALVGVLAVVIVALVFIVRSARRRLAQEEAGQQ
jgi:uncharacterized membrane protein YdjX (TVP38/TMEM64 family)